MKKLLIITSLIMLCITFLCTNCSKNRIPIRQVDEVLGVGETEDFFAAYPNPTNDLVIVNCIGMTRYAIYDCYGQLLKDEKLNCDECIIYFDAYPSGLYTLRVFIGDDYGDKIITKL